MCTCWKYNETMREKRERKSEGEREEARDGKQFSQRAIVGLDGNISASFPTKQFNLYTARVHVYVFGNFPCKQRNMIKSR